MNIVVLHGRPFFKMCLIILEGDTEQIDRLDRANLLYLVIQKFAEEVDLSPKAVSNNEMGYIFEDLIRRFSEMSNETAGEHFTPREVIRLMVSILFDPDMKHICEPFFMAKLYEMIFTFDEIKQRLQPIFAGHQIRQAILFGSYGKGTATKTSDVDLLVDSNLRGLKFMGFVEELREALDDKDMDVFDIKHIEPKSRIAEEIKQTGIEIYAR